jgi:DNA-binding NarL/FixJ family response regulator
MKKSQVFIVDDHPIFRKGLKQLINEESDMTVCDEAEDVFSATTKLRAVKPDIAIVDITLNDTSGLELIKFINDNRMNIPSLCCPCMTKRYSLRGLYGPAQGLYNEA